MIGLTKLTKALRADHGRNVDVAIIDDTGRRFFLGHALLGAAALGLIATVAGCAITTDNGVTTVTLDVSKIKAYAQAGISAATTISALATAVPALQPYMGGVAAASATLTALLSTFEGEAGTETVISYSDAGIKATVDNLLGSVQDVAADITTAITNAGVLLSDSVREEASLTLNALNTIVALFKAVLSSTSAGALPMTESRAFQILGVAR